MKKSQDQPTSATTKFNTITGEDWKRELKTARSTPNKAYQQIQMKLHPQNSTPGEVNTTPDIKPVTIGELVEVLELVLEESRGISSYYLSAARKRLDDIKKRL